MWFTKETMEGYIRLISNMELYFLPLCQAEDWADQHTLRSCHGIRLGHLAYDRRLEAIHMIRKGQACCSVGLLHCFILGLFAAKN